MRGKLLTKVELAALAALRTRFLDGSNAGGAYWRSEEELALYDTTFGERIGWKWDTVISELRARGWRPRAKHVTDWGCGSGVAGRRVIAAWDAFESLTLTDVSPLAMRFAMRRASSDFPRLAVRSAAAGTDVAPGGLLLVSHVLNELDDATRSRLLHVARQASEVIWVESGTHADSRALVAEREKMRDLFQVVAPCTHGSACGMLTPENERHWCHHFGRVPPGVSQDARWAQFGRELGIDMRALPFSFLVLERENTATASAAGFSRIIGRPREAKGRMEVLSCDAVGVGELLLQKRDVPGLFKLLQKGRADAAYRWQRDGRRIIGAAPLDSQGDQSAPGETDGLPSDDDTE